MYKIYLSLAFLCKCIYAVYIHVNLSVNIVMAILKKDMFSGGLSVIVSNDIVDVEVRRSSSLNLKPV